MNDILVPVSPGELLDKITILRIKEARIQDAAKLANVKLELSLLERTWDDFRLRGRAPGAEEHALQAGERAAVGHRGPDPRQGSGQSFDRDFIELARSVYVTTTNARPSRSTSTIALGSRLVEEKSYKQYR